MSNLDRLGNRISVALKPDEEGYLGRECPVKTCLGYFKITPGTGLKGPAACHCPYCGHSGDQNTFFTPEQIEYAKSVALRRITDAIHQDLKSLEFEHKPRGAFGIGISMKVTRSGQHPIRYYREKTLETKVICEKCTLRFAIYGVFGWCPDCGEHNSLQILSKNLELAQKEVGLSASVDAELAEHLVGDALENVVSAFDGFGREICSQKGAEIRFQNMIGARRRVSDHDLAGLQTLLAALSFGQENCERLDGSDSLFNRVARDLSVEMKNHWRPDFPFFNKRNREQLASIANECGFIDGHGPIGSMKKADLVAALVKHFGNAMSAADALPSQIKARDWLPEAMRFPAADPNAITDADVDDDEEDAE